MNISSTEENYIKAIYRLQQDHEVVSTNALADALQTKPASVTDMAQKLKKKHLAQYEKYKGIQLTPSGEKLALNIIRRHRLWEYFLVEKLKFSWEEVHEVAEELEHVRSPKLIAHLDEFLGNPRTDPHGDPIPDEKGKMSKVSQQTLLNNIAHKRLEVTGVGSQSTKLLEFLKGKGILLGTQLEVLQQYAFDNAVEIKIKNQPPFTVSEQVAKNIYVKVYGKN